MRNKVVYTLIAVVLLLVSVFATAKIIQGKDVPEKGMEGSAILSVKADSVKFNDYEITTSYRGRISAFENVSLSSEVTGKILQGDVRLKTGETFTKGQLLINIYNEDVEASLKSVKSSFLRTVSSVLPDMKVDFPDEFEKWNAFFQSISVDEELPELPVVNSDKEKIYMASKGLLSEYYTIHQQEINMLKYKIYAPFNGSFKTVNKEPGSVASMGGELANIVRTDVLEVSVPVMPEDARKIKVGNKVDLSKSGIVGTGKVTRIANLIDESTQLVNVYIQYVPSSADPFYYGEFVDANFTYSGEISGMRLPRESVFNEDDVYVISDGMLEIKEVQVLETEDDYCIVGGLDVGEILVTENLADVREGMKVQARF